MRKGFTLIEMIVVIGIILGLTGILLPVLTSARARAKAASCISNVRQLYIATALYCVDNDSLLPFHINDNGLLCGADPDCLYWPPSVGSPYPALLQADLALYGGSPKVFDCPYAMPGNFIVDPGFGDYVYSYPVPRETRDEWPWIMSIDNPYIQNSALWADDRVSFDDPQHPDRSLTAAFPDGHLVNQLEIQFSSWYPD
jgi:prepilin-type N-terminal cleavage/methylation domain-containing protein